MIDLKVLLYSIFHLIREREKSYKQLVKKIEKNVHLLPQRDDKQQKIAKLFVKFLAQT